LHLHNHPLEDLISPVQSSFPMNSASPGCYPRLSHHAPLGLVGPNAAHFDPVWAHRVSSGLVWFIWPSFQTIEAHRLPWCPGLALNSTLDRSRANSLHCSPSTNIRPHP
jgi:hypothetical protein